VGVGGVGWGFFFFLWGFLSVAGFHWLFFVLVCFGGGGVVFGGFFFLGFVVLGVVFFVLGVGVFVVVCVFLLGGLVAPP
ncbi:hypothetical protein AB1B06_28515, partial [Pseudomonas aeruginosa]|uniref:hypothetical protein n=1 Tax=Pseudomonas aeruginosa TaxID=287 RepID=UPI003452B6CF